MGRGFERHARTFTVLTFISRITGFARDALLARVFGAGVVMDAFNFAFQVPNLFRRLFGRARSPPRFFPSTPNSTATIQRPRANSRG